MTGRWGKNRAKKQLETSLGQAPKDSDKGSDLSHLRKPINTSIFGLKQVLSLFQTATNEVQNYITYECDVLYECRICRTIFRSLANFILHKRSYCREKYNHSERAHPENSGGFVVGDIATSPEEDTITATPPSPPEAIAEEGAAEKNEEIIKQEVADSSNKKDSKILPIIDKLVKKQEIKILAKNTLNEDFSSKGDNSDDDVVFVSEESNMVLQKIDTSSAAVFQTAVKCPQVSPNTGLMKSEVMEIHGIFENNEVVLGSNGKVCNFETNKKIFKPNIPKQDLVCTECKFTFSTEKTLTHHIKYKHNKTCIVYPCPDCKETFANAWSVYRHLYKVHRRTSSQVRRMRAQIHSSGIRKDQEPEKKKDKSRVEVKESEENQWMNNFEGDKDLQMCGGCGKRFERKAALHSHSQMCTKRIAVCNTIKENSLKTKTTDHKSKLEKLEKNGVRVVKGSAKRKPNSMFVHKVTVNVEDIPAKNENEEKVVEPSKEDCNKSENCVQNGTEKVANSETFLGRNLSQYYFKFKDGVQKQSHEKEKMGRKGAILAKYFKQASLEKINEVISDSDEEKENSATITPEKQVIENNANEEVTITKYKDTQAEETTKLQNTLPEIEIFTISDDSCDSNEVKKKPLTITETIAGTTTTITKVKKNEDEETTESTNNGNKSLKRKRAASLDIDNKNMKIADDYKDCLNDDLDQCFFAKAVPYIDKTELKCVPCQTSFLSQYQLLWHMSLHFSWFRFQCSKCSFMSFNKYDCTTHAYVQHGTPNNLMGSTVLPIPKWKVLLAAHNFTELSEEIINNNTVKPLNEETEDSHEEVKVPDDSNIKTMPCLEAVDAKNEESDKVETNETSEVQSSETIVLEDDEMPDICHESAQVADTVILSDDEVSKELSVKEGKSSEKAGPSRINSRPIRNRVRSVKTLQNDFIYDLAKVLKLNDNSIKNSRMKKSFGKALKE